MAKNELAFCTMEWAEDRKHIKEVKNPRVIETGYRSPQLTLWTLGPDEWLLFLKLPDYAARKKPQRKPDVIQLPLFGLDGDHTDADAALGGSSDGRIASGGRSYRWPSHRARSADSGSSTTSDVVSKRMVALRESSYV